MVHFQHLLHLYSPCGSHYSGFQCSLSHSTLSHTATRS